MDVWQEFLRQTLEGDALSYAEYSIRQRLERAKNLSGCSNISYDKEKKNNLMR